MRYLQGQLLVAAPSLLDPNFIHSVVLVIQHNDEGAMGVILNRPTQTTLSEAWRQLTDDACDNYSPLYQGGPIDGPLMVVHTSEDESQIEIIPGLHFTIEAPRVERLVTSAGVTGQFFVGYAGWSSEQLQDEIAAGAWLVTAVTPALVFNRTTDPWKLLLQALTPTHRYPNVHPKFIPPDPSVN